MAFFNQDHGDAFQRPKKEDDPGLFTQLWPSDSAGDGRVVANNSRTGAAQGKGSFLRKAPCKLCGYPNDLNKVDHTGGSEDGQGAGGSVSSNSSSVLINGVTLHADGSGNQQARKGAGCAMCFSKNSSKEKIDRVENMNPIPPLGF